MARSRLKETGINGEKDGVTELHETKEIFIQEDTAADGEDFVNFREEFIEEEDIYKTKTVAEKVEEVNVMWKGVVAEKDEELECLTKKLEEERKDREEELKKWKIKEDENTIEWKKDKEDLVQLRKTVEELKEKIRKERVVIENEKEKLFEERANFHAKYMLKKK